MVSKPEGFSARVRAALDAVPAAEWLRIVGYDDSSLGFLDGPRLDKLAPTDIPIKVQHRSGHQWVVNAAGRKRLEAGGTRVAPDGILWDDDAALRDRSGERGALLKAVALEADALAAAGGIGITDMTPTSSASDLAELQAVVEHSIRLRAYGREDGGLDSAKVIITDHDYPDPALLAARLTNPAVARVAVHAVSFEALALIASTEQRLGARVRVEHAFLANDDLIDLLVEHGVQIGVHPGFLYSQGDRLRRVLSAEEQMSYQRLASMRKRGLPMFGGTDRPFSTADIWRCMASAVTRRTVSGEVLGASEALTPEEAFALFTPAGLVAEAGEPVVREGDPADVCLLDRPWGYAREELAATTVALTVNRGRVTAAKCRSL
jgi:predicted amidohydrolase YtcJ